MWKDYWLTELNHFLNGLNQCSIEHVWLIEVSSGCAGGREACRQFCAASHERQRARLEQPRAIEWSRGTRRVKSIFVIAVNQPPHANPIISVCFPRVALASADISIIETRIICKTFKININSLRWELRNDVTMS